MPWIGRRKVAFIPTYRPNALPPDVIPPDWANDILRRVLYDPAPNTGVDRSFRAWVRAASSGVADIDPIVLAMRTIDRQDVPPGVFESELGGQLRSQGFDHAAIVMLGGPGAGTNDGFWSRFVMAERTGIWVMEVIHGIAGFKDLYPFGNDIDPEVRAIGTFDEMSAASLTHPSTYTKVGLGWLDPAPIAHHVGATADYALQLVGLPQPPAGGGSSAVRIGTDVPYVMVEARMKSDQFDGGVSSEGVIAYRVQTSSPHGDRQNRRLPLFLLTLTALQPGQSAGLDNGVTLTVTGALPGGFAIRVDDPFGHLIDRTAHVGAPTAASAPTSCVVRGTGAEVIAYRDATGHLQELWRNAVGYGRTDLTANAGAPTAQGTPFAYVDPTNNMVVLLYRGTDNHVHSLYWTTGAVGHDSLTGSINAPRTVGDPVGWFSQHDGFHHVVYRTGDGHLHELWWQGQGQVGHGDLTVVAGAVPAAGDPSAYYDPVRSNNIVVFRGTDRHIRSLYWSSGDIGQDDLSGFARTPPAAGDPFAYHSAPDDTHQIFYRSDDGHLHELSWPNVAPVAGRDLTALTNAPAAAGNPVANYNPAFNTKHVFYRAPDGTLHELWRQAGHTDIGHVNLTAGYTAPPAAERPNSWATARAPNQHVAYRGTDGHIYELLW